MARSTQHTKKRYKIVAARQKMVQKSCYSSILKIKMELAATVGLLVLEHAQGEMFQMIGEAGSEKSTLNSEK
jgi:ABC-type polysaccharide/polyol phosphate transport system ATPase subunit